MKSLMMPLYTHSKVHAFAPLRLGVVNLRVDLVHIVLERFCILTWYVDPIVFQPKMKSHVFILRILRAYLDHHCAWRWQGHEPRDGCLMSQNQSIRSGDCSVLALNIEFRIINQCHCSVRSISTPQPALHQLSLTSPHPLQTLSLRLQHHMECRCVRPLGPSSQQPGCHPCCVGMRDPSAGTSLLHGRYTVWMQICQAEHATLISPLSVFVQHVNHSFDSNEDSNTASHTASNTIANAHHLCVDWNGTVLQHAHKISNLKGLSLGTHNSAA